MDKVRILKGRNGTTMARKSFRSISAQNSVLGKRKKEAQENITLEMIPEFEYSEEDTVKVRAWMVLKALEEGMSEKSVQLMFRMTAAEASPYRESWERALANTQVPGLVEA